MCARSEQATLAPLTSSAAASLARISATRERVLDWLVRALDSGPSTLGSLANYCPASSSWKTSQRSLLGDSPPFSGTLPLSGTMRSGFLFVLLTWERRTDESDCLSWPTPDAGRFNDGENPESFLARQAKLKTQGMNGNGCGTPLAMAIKLWPTPGAADASGGRSSSLEAMERGTNSTGSKLQVTLGSAARHWPTPTTSMTTEGDLAQAFFRSDDPRRPDCKGSALNPAWVESIQGFPPGWTEVSPLDPPNPPRSGKRPARSKPAPIVLLD